MKKHIRFIINPISGIGKKDTLPDLIKKTLNHNLFTYDIAFTEYAGHAVKIGEQAVQEGIDILAVVGGDGSVNEVAGTLVYQKTTLAIIPSGSGNGIARHLGIPMNITKAIDRINKQDYARMDTLDINGLPAFGVSGFGFDAVIAKKFNNHGSRGFFNYAKLVIREWRNYKGINIIVNDKEYKNLLFCSIANTSQFGNNFYVSPNSDVFDGEFEVVMVPLPSTLKLIQLLFASVQKRLSEQDIKTIKVNSAELKGVDFYGHIDGEPIKFDNSTISIKCKGKSLRIIK